MPFSTTDSVSTSVTDCSSSITSSTFASDDATAELGSFVFSQDLDDDGEQHTDVSEDYDDEFVGVRNPSPFRPVIQTLAPIAECSISTRSPSALVEFGNEPFEEDADDATICGSDQLAVTCDTMACRSPCLPLTTAVITDDGTCNSPMPVPAEEAYQELEKSRCTPSVRCGNVFVSLP